jgi:catechol 2,3-dioxygenase-like lactoylglutathione lyase family enzyme
MSSQGSTSAGVQSAPVSYAGHMTAAIGVSDMERSKAWFQDVLGFEHIYTLSDWGWCEMRTPVPGVNLGIGQEESVQPAGGATLTFGVTDIGSARAHLERHDVRFDGETREIEGMVRLATFYDPDGNTFMLAQRLDTDQAGRGG